jgi:mono/diheme cytochrome c family protein
MKINLRLACFALVTLAMAVPMATLRAQEQAPSGDADKGHKLFDSVGCYQCHGYAGQGGGAAGPEVAKTKLPFDAFLMQVRKPSNQMPPYEAAVLPDQSAADIYAYIQTLPAPVDMSKVNLPH